MLYMFGFQHIGVVVSDLYFVDPEPDEGQEGAERGVRLEVRLLEAGSVDGSIYAARPISVARPVWRADLLETADGPPGSLDRTHHHPAFRGWEPGSRRSTPPCPLSRWRGWGRPSRICPRCSTRPSSTRPAWAPTTAVSCVRLYRRSSRPSAGCWRGCTPEKSTGPGRPSAPTAPGAAERRPDELAVGAFVDGPGLRRHPGAGGGRPGEAVRAGRRAAAGGGGERRAAGGGGGGGTAGGASGGGRRAVAVA